MNKDYRLNSNGWMKCTICDREAHELTGYSDNEQGSDEWLCERCQVSIDRGGRFYP